MNDFYPVSFMEHVCVVEFSGDDLFVDFDGDAAARRQHLVEQLPYSNPIIDGLVPPVEQNLHTLPIVHRLKA